MNRYSWKEGDITIADSQCGLCEHQIKDNAESCAKYDKKPDKVISNDIRCPCYSKIGAIKL